MMMLSFEVMKQLEEHVLVDHRVRACAAPHHHTAAAAAAAGGGGVIVIVVVIMMHISILRMSSLSIPCIDNCAQDGPLQ